ncbi:hypothetical protein MRB53_023854 [Persea americana]|uniref:Uncharacterized protein n=1 Tax=Persea americana TaxID=3435 RepID=A0ACC2LBF5_PERAE|nr:hypothetical protein MRB53_023854 [Persea americana]
MATVVSPDSLPSLVTTVAAMGLIKPSSLRSIRSGAGPTLIEVDPSPSATTIVSPVQRQPTLASPLRLSTQNPSTMGSLPSISHAMHWFFSKGAAPAPSSSQQRRRWVCSLFG